MTLLFQLFHPLPNLVSLFLKVYDVIGLIATLNCLLFVSMIILGVCTHPQMFNYRTSLFIIRSSQCLFDGYSEGTFKQISPVELFSFFLKMAIGSSGPSKLLISPIECARLNLNSHLGLKASFLLTSVSMTAVCLPQLKPVRTI